VSWPTTWSLMPPHCGKNGPCEMFCGAAVVWVGPADVGSEPEHAANTGTTATASAASAVALRGLRFAHLLGVTPCTVAAAENLNHRHAD
jgi:hypothetical protein